MRRRTCPQGTATKVHFYYAPSDVPSGHRHRSALLLCAVGRALMSPPPKWRYRFLWTLYARNYVFTLTRLYSPATSAYPLTPYVVSSIPSGGRFFWFEEYTDNAAVPSGHRQILFVIWKTAVPSGHRQILYSSRKRRCPQGTANGGRRRCAPCPHSHWRCPQGTAALSV